MLLRWNYEFVAYKGVLASAVVEGKSRFELCGNVTMIMAAESNQERHGSKLSSKEAPHRIEHRKSRRLYFKDTTIDSMIEPKDKLRHLFGMGSCLRCGQHSITIKDT